MSAAPAQEWWTSSELAAACLPDLPSARQPLERLIEREGWRSASQARRRQGRGGGWEYHWSLLPIRARRQLLRETGQTSGAKALAKKAPDRAALWSWFDGLPEAVKAEARRRLTIVQNVEGLVATGLTKYEAVAQVEVSKVAGARTIWRWLAALEGVRPDDYLPALAPRHRAAPQRRARVHVDPEFMDLIKGDFLRPAGPSFATVYRRACRIAAGRGIEVVSPRTALRRYKSQVSKPTEVLCRKGADALKSYYPPQVRDKTALAPMEAVNADFHKFDVFVEWPLEPGQERPYIGRPQMVAFQDIFSGRILSWRLDQTPNRVAVALAAGDMIETWGIPEHVLMDNGREFAAKALTGGAPTRFRFKMRDTDPPGLFVSLGCKIHWATPYAGQSKPIERAFRDLCDALAKDPRFDGAYTGNRPDAKPEDYGSRAIPLADFLTVLGEGIEEHNTRQGRRSEVAMGRSFADVFDEAYASAPIRKATDAQRRLWLLGAEGLRADAKSGLIKFLGNEYWDAWMQEVAGEQLIVRFDPADLFAGLHVYSAENAYLGHAPARSKAGFFDIEEARAHAKARREWMKAERAAADAHRRYRAADLGKMLDAVPLAPAAPPEAKVVRAVFGRQGRPELPAPSPERAAELEAVHADVVADLAARREAPPEETARERFRRALELERAEARGEAMTRDQKAWLARFQNTAEYRGERAVWDDFGDEMFG